MNDVKLSGNIGNELVLRYTTDQTAVVNLRLAVRHPRRSGDEPDWFDVTLWGRPAEVLCEHGTTGDHIVITSAHLAPEHVEVDGKRYATVKVHARHFEFAGRPGRHRDSDA